MNDGKMCGGVNAARVQHARICPGMIADGLSETTDHDRRPVKATAKAGRANKLNYPIERKKTSRNGYREGSNRGRKGLFHADWRPLSGFAG
ncbi:hypothetical protein [Paraburkholderia aromaticivorans]|uniref:hypothetical protein n=1 Tax=Paraburkholderia aromaticivorans TaxID=2026199 RepID=UPI0012FE6B37|nr:hypothetical protein [Paraburkholderia aromaticivorans]